MKRLGRYEGIARLALLLVILPAAVYRLSLSRTLALWSEVREEQRTIAEAVADPAQPAAIPAALDTVELIARGGLLDSLGRLAADTGVEVVRYSPYRTREGDNFALRTAEIVLSGGFAPLIRTLDRLERSLPACRFLSTEFKTVRRGRQSSLQLTILVQQLTDKP